MNELEELRRDIDEADERLLEALRERLVLSARVGRLKLGSGAPVVDRERERHVLDRAREHCGEAFASAAAHIYTAILRESCAIQRPDVSRVIDISRELLSTPVYPGDSAPCVTRVRSMQDGEIYNLSEIHMGAHNSTHADAPLHFIADGADIASCAPEMFTGWCLVRTFDGDLREEDVSSLPGNCERLLIKGGKTVTEAAASALADRGIKLVGVEANSVGMAKTHLALLGAGVAILESLELSDTPDGEYFLIAQPLKIAGCEGAPCRALLLY